MDGEKVVCVVLTESTELSLVQKVSPHPHPTPNPHPYPYPYPYPYP